jgi:hypothetical protein
MCFKPAIGNPSVRVKRCALRHVAFDFLVQVRHANRRNNLGPHFTASAFRRRRQEHVDLFTFQFDRRGGGFIIEIGQCQPEGFTTHWGKLIPPEKVRIWDLPPKQRARIQPSAGLGTDSWFRFDGAVADIFTRTATSVIPFVEQAEKMFDDFEQVQKTCALTQSA